MSSDNPVSVAHVTDPLSRYSLSPVEGTELAAALRAADGVLVCRDGSGTLHVHALPDVAGTVSIGRAERADLRLVGDDQVSRAHAEVRRVAGEWVLANLSRNGTLVNAARVGGPVRLADGDRVRLGRTVMAVLAPGERSGVDTAPAQVPLRLPALTEAQRRALVALCRPLLESGVGAPASNKAIAAELHLSVDAVKTRLGRLFVSYGFDELRPLQKRVALAHFAVDVGLISRQDIKEP